MLIRRANSTATRVIRCATRSDRRRLVGNPNKHNLGMCLRCFVPHMSPSPRANMEGKGLHMHAIGLNFKMLASLMTHYAADVLH